DVANFDLSTSPITITLSGTIGDAHVERALGHEVSEIRSILEQGAGGTKRSASHNALDSNTTASALSHDDVGKLGELRVLQREVATGGPKSASSLNELKFLLRSSGC